MCPGNQRRREHHRQQEQMRAETAQRNIYEQAERDRQAELARMQQLQNEANMRQQQALAAIAESSKQPIKIKTGEEAATPIMRTRQKSAEARRSLADLRISRTPAANIGAGTSGTNIG